MTVRSKAARAWRACSTSAAAGPGPANTAAKSRRERVGPRRPVGGVGAADLAHRDRREHRVVERGRERERDVAHDRAVRRAADRGRRPRLGPRQAPRPSKKYARGTPTRSPATLPIGRGDVVRRRRRAVAGHRREQIRRVRHRARAQADVIEGRAGAEQPGRVDQAERGLEADTSAQRRGNAHAAAGVAAGGGHDQAGGHGRRRSAARAAGDPRAIVRVVRRAEERIDGRDAAAELVGVGLAEEHRAGLGEPRDDHGVVVGHPPLVQARAAGRADAARGEEVLVRDRDAHERSACSADREARHDASGVVDGPLAGHGDEGAQGGVLVVDAGEIRGGDVDGRDPAGGDGVGELGNRQRRDVVERRRLRRAGRSVRRRARPATVRPVRRSRRVASRGQHSARPSTRL